MIWVDFRQPSGTARVPVPKTTGAVAELSAHVARRDAWQRPHISEAHRNEVLERIRARPSWWRFW